MELFSLLIPISIMSSVASLLMGALFWHFYRLYQQSYLKYWAGSWFAYSLFGLGSIIANLSLGTPPTTLLQVFRSFFTIAIAYVQIAWLLIGVYQLSTTKQVTRFHARLITLGSVLLAAALVLPFALDPDGRALRYILRVGIRHVLIGLAFLGGARVMFRVWRRQKALGALLVMYAFILQSGSFLFQSQYAFHGFFGFDMPTTWIPYITLFDFLTTTILGLGLILWLLESERRDVLLTRASLRASKEQLQLALDAVQMGTWTWHIETNAVAWSTGVEALFDLQPNTFDGTYEAYLALVYAPDRARVERTLEAVLTEGGDYVVEHRVVWQDGSHHWLEGRGRVDRGEDGTPLRMRGTVLDITERKRANEALRESENNLSAVLENAFDLILSIDRAYRVLTINSLGKAVFKQVLGADVEQGQDILEQIPPALKPDWKERYDRALAGERFVMEDHFVEGVVEFYSEVSFHPIWDNEVVTGVSVFSRDITDRKQAERQQEQLIEELEAKNAELERFTYTVSHDLKSPLVTIKGFLGLLEKDLAKGNQERVRHDIARIQAAAERMKQLLNELLELSRVGRLMNAPESIDLNQLIPEVLAVLTGDIRAQTGHIEVASDLPMIYGDRVRLAEVFQNLIGNALKFMGDRTDARVAIGARQDADETICYVRDNGVGIDPKYHERIFDLFIHLDPSTEGTGIGLALAKRIVEVHGGRIWVESEGVGKGSTFYVALPNQASENTNKQEISA